MNHSRIFKLDLNAAYDMHDKFTCYVNFKIPSSKRNSRFDSNIFTYLGMKSQVNVYLQCSFGYIVIINCTPTHACCLKLLISRDKFPTSHNFLFVVVITFYCNSCNIHIKIVLSLPFSK